MKKRYMKFVEIVCATLILFIFIEPIAVQADTGPKPSVVVEFEGIEDEIYYVTLLSEVKSTGPWSAGNAYQEWYENEEVWEKLNAYSDTDGFYFLGCYENCSVTEEFVWSYYPPDTFKILVYFPENDSFLVSDIQERYAFDSYYTADVKEGMNVTQTSAIVKDGMNVSRTYDYTWEVVSLVCRILITILLELGVAWLFYFRSKRQIQVIVLTNIVTQTILNLLLNIICYQKGSWAFVFHYIWLEILVFVIEGSIYAAVLHRFIQSDQKKIHPWLYSLVANVVSFVVGLCIAKIVPGIF